jgi:hypothetical protein
MFHFTIRELVLLTLVVAMGFAWWRDHRQNESRRATTHALAKRLRDNLALAKEKVDGMEFKLSFILHEKSSFIEPDWSLIDAPLNDSN